MYCKTIKKLFYGNICPSDVNLHNNPITANINKKLLKEIDILEREFKYSRYKYNHFNKYNHLLNLQFEQLYIKAFEDGFSLGMKLTFEGINHK